MAHLKEYSNFIDFANFNKELINTNPFLYFNLDNTLNRVLKREVSVIRFFNVIDNNENVVCVLLVKDECLIYSTRVNKDIVSITSQGIEFYKFNRFTFFGSKNIIDALFSKHEVDYTEQKYRNYYECSKTLKSFEFSLGNIEMASLNRLNELVDLGEKFADEFYGKNRPSDNITNVIINGIRNKNTFQWILNDKAVAIAQIIYNEFEYPVIGNVYTHSDFRSQGIASSLTYKVTDGLLKNGHKKCWLMTDGYNLYSNKAFIKVGYNLVGEYVVRYKEK